jgi:hypothetical protein
MLAAVLSDGTARQRHRKSNGSHRSNIEKFLPIHRIPPSR